MAKKSKKPLIVIFGRTNVGKSTLFNRLTERRGALVSDIEGTTRDSNVGKVEWQGYSFNIVDTGGIMDVNLMSGKKTKSTDIDVKVQLQATDYLKKAHVILFLVDAKEGLIPTDKQMALELKKIVKNPEKIILIANKADSPRVRREAYEFNKLALGEPIAVSASTGSGTGDLLDEIIGKIKHFTNKDVKEDEEEDKDVIKVSIIGKPNVGKSSLVNAILGEERIIVSPIAHTTREPQDTDLEYKGQKIKLIDTAGISRRGRQSARQGKFMNTLEKHSILKTLGELRRADIVLFVLDINEELTQQDAKIIDEIFKQQVSLIIVANKWDQIEEKDTKVYTQIIHRQFPYAQWVPIQFTSALTGSKVKKVLDVILEVAEGRKVDIGANALGKFLGRIIKKHRPVKQKGTKHPHIYELKQSHVDPPKFNIRIGARDTIHDSYVRFIENRLREKFSFVGTPIYIGVEKNKMIHGKMDEKTETAMKVKRTKKQSKNLEHNEEEGEEEGQE